MQSKEVRQQTDLQAEGPNKLNKPPKPHSDGSHRTPRPITNRRKPELSVDSFIAIVVFILPFGMEQMGIPKSFVVGLVSWAAGIALIFRVFWITASKLTRLVRTLAICAAACVVIFVAYTPVTRAYHAQDTAERRPYSGDKDEEKNPDDPTPPTTAPANSPTLQDIPAVRESKPQRTRLFASYRQTGEPRFSDIFRTHETAGDVATSPMPAGSDEVPPALDPVRRTFVVFSTLTVSDARKGKCQLTDGDVLTRISDTPDDNNEVSVRISASKKGDCTIDSEVKLGVDDLQEMHNHFQEQIEKGMKNVQSPPN